MGIVAGTSPFVCADLKGLAEYTLLLLVPFVSQITSVFINCCLVSDFLGISK